MTDAIKLAEDVNTTTSVTTQIRVSVLHWNRPAECIATVQNLSGQAENLRITVIDNNSEASKLALLRSSLPPDVEVLGLRENIGWGRAHNVVLKRWLDEETSEFCIVSAHDSLPQNDCINLLVKAMQSRPNWGIACPEYGIPELTSFSALRGAQVKPCEPREAGTLESVAFCHGTLMIFRRSCLEEIGLFDEKYFAYGDEAEIALRARKFGWEAGLAWGAVLINPGSWSSAPVIAYLWTRNTLRLARTYGGLFGCLGRTIIVLAATLREQVRGSTGSSLNSPRARLLGIRDYFLGYHGAPPESIIALRK